MTNRTTKQKLDADPHLAYMIGELPDPVKLSPGLGATEECPVLHLEYHVPPPAEEIQVSYSAPEG